MPEPDTQVYVTKKQLEGPGNASVFHVDRGCYEIQDKDDEEIEEMSLAEAEEECERQARCCSTIPALEDLN